MKHISNLNNSFQAEQFLNISRINQNSGNVKHRNNMKIYTESVGSKISKASKSIGTFVEKSIQSSKENN
jgi:hypothetical protein